MRIPIREQLTLIILLTSGICLSVASIATWFTERDFVVTMRSSRLSLAASLKAAQLASNLELMQTTSSFISNRVLIQSALRRYINDGNNTASNWVAAKDDLEAAIGGDGSIGALLSLQARVFPSNGSGPNGANALFNATSNSLNQNITLPYHCPDGSPAILGDYACGSNGSYGYPPALYPNLTYDRFDGTMNTVAAAYDSHALHPGNTLLLGPMPINETYSLISLTIPIVNDTSNTDVIGFLTVVMDAGLILQVIRSVQGLGTTGQALLVGPNTPSNVFPVPPEPNYLPPEDRLMEYVVPVNRSDPERTHGHAPMDHGSTAFNTSQFPIVAEAFTSGSQSSDSSGSSLNTPNEAGERVSVGYALIASNMVDWAILVEMARSEIMQPIDHLRKVLLACCFGTAGFMVLIAFPLAHFFSVPIRRLREATTRSVAPPGTESRSSLDSDIEGDGHEGALHSHHIMSEKRGLSDIITFGRRLTSRRSPTIDSRRRRGFRIPAKVKEHKHLIKDELSDLTATFNEMSDELMMQYSRLEERVQQRTAELELSKKAAEAANESKTLFIANISHELKTPLNGILGMCAVCMQEDDPIRLKRSLGIIYKSGDLLLNLLTDLLTFSKNEVGQQLSLDEKEFRLRDISTQVLAIFEKQAQENSIDLRVRWEGLPAEGDAKSYGFSSTAASTYGPIGTGKVEDMILWGDMHRILQVVINLLSNSLKFTPQGGSVTLTIRCLAGSANEARNSAASLRSRTSTQSKKPSVRIRSVESDVSLAPSELTSGKAPGIQTVPSIDSKAAPPPGKSLCFEFEVQDTGPGIPESQQEQIFQPFMQGDIGLSKKYGGTGLGLSICSQLAALMRGTVSVRSSVGHGSTFTMRIPLRYLASGAGSSATSFAADTDDESSKPPHSAPSTAARQSNRMLGDDGAATRRPSLDRADSQTRLVGLSTPFFATGHSLDTKATQTEAMQRITAAATTSKRLRVLVAEDNKVNQEVVLRMLKLEDIYDVTVANDGQEALDLIKETMRPNGDCQPYNLIFMDVQMPRVDGLTSTRLIREIGYQAPIVALTAFSEESNVNDCMSAGMNYFLSKPIRRPQLKKVLKQYCTPIVEESEDMPLTNSTTASTDCVTELNRAQDGGNTTVVLVNGAHPNPSCTDSGQSP